VMTSQRHCNSVVVVTKETDCPSFSAQEALIGLKGLHYDNRVLKHAYETFMLFVLKNADNYGGCIALLVHIPEFDRLQRALVSTWRK